MIISHAILQILDYKSGKNYLSDVELSLNSSTTIEYILKLYNTCMSSASKREGSFKSESKAKNLLSQYKDRQIDFVTLTKEITSDVDKILSKMEDCPSLDLVFSEFNEDGINYFGLVILENKETITHKIETIDGKTSNIVVKNLYTLPQNGISVNTYILVDLNSFKIYSAEKKRVIEGDRHFVLEEYFDAEFSMSSSQQFKILKQVTSMVAEDNGLNPAVAMSKVKSFLLDNPVINNMRPEEISQTVFEKPEAKVDFDAKMHSKGLVENISIDRSFVLKKADSHKIKTDTGIEITFPSEYFEDKDHLEFIDEDDGTISIRLKNINKIINR